jgi:hypothetical protein
MTSRSGHLPNRHRHVHPTQAYTMKKPSAFCGRQFPSAKPTLKSGVKLSQEYTFRTATSPLTSDSAQPMTVATPQHDCHQQCGEELRCVRACHATFAVNGMVLTLISSTPRLQLKPLPESRLSTANGSNKEEKGDPNLQEEGLHHSKPAATDLLAVHRMTAACCSALPALPCQACPAHHPPNSHHTPAAAAAAAGPACSGRHQPAAWPAACSGCASPGRRWVRVRRAALQRMGTYVPV